MRFSAFVLLFATAAVTANIAGQRAALMAIRGIFERQLTICTPVSSPATCEKSCGPGHVQCISFPNCYNPGAGESCCSNGKYCPVHSYCTDAGCCPVGFALEECGATFTLSVIAPPAANTGALVAETASAVVGTTTEKSISTSPGTPIGSSTTMSSAYSSSKLEPSMSVAVSIPSLSTSRTSSSRSTPASSSMATQVTNAACKMGVDAVKIAFGGFGVFCIFFQVG
ncbi:hypothetical protein PZA11_007345 [Diplocarpon coronariae]|uniref:Uncharacterized protein n=1 Tax=Diplocarpon coronariae TaxID=2795749 RepID=A0A218Z8U0_9HELO|nr:hypothetical protein B2J93_689 [Marssonina coronariae]